MSDPFFDNYGDEITFEDKVDLILKFSEIDCTVPRRELGRKTFHRERESIKTFMESLACNDKLKYPLTIMKHETPDFIITRKSQFTIGLEHTEATTEQIQQTFAKFERSKQDLYMDNNAGGEYGYRFKKAARSILNEITKKLIKLNKPEYEKCDRNELLVYTDMCPEGDEDIALEKLIITYNGLSLHKEFKILFDSISIIFKRILRHNVID